jgi:hypothetical protein
VARDRTPGRASLCLFLYRRFAAAPEGALVLGHARTALKVVGKKLPGSPPDPVSREPPSGYHQEHMVRIPGILILHFGLVLFGCDNSDRALAKPPQAQPSGAEKAPGNGQQLEPGQREFLERKLKAHLQKQPEFANLRERLMTLGGLEVVPRDEPDLEKILARGISFSGGNVNLQPGDPSDCHRNTARLWKKEAGRVSIATGWALSSDGLWLQHSWAINGTTVIETTARRSSYFGYVLSPSEAADFCRRENQ